MTAVSAALFVALLAPAAKEDTAPVDVKACVAKGLKWLAEQQKEDGSWVGRADSAPTTTTAMAGVALLMEGSTLTTGTYAPNLRKAVEWVEKTAQRSGSLVSTNRTDAARPITAHAQALLFLACAYDVDDDAVRRERVREVLKRAVEYAAEVQTARGGWGLTASRAGAGSADDPLTTAQMLHALFATRKAGVTVARKVTDSAAEYLAKITSTTGAVARRGVDDEAARGTTAVQVQLTSGAAAAFVTSDGPRPEVYARWLRSLRGALLLPWPSRTNAAVMYTQLYLARLTFALGDNGHRASDPGAKYSTLTWSNYRATVFRSLKEAQVADGSWPDTVPGPTYGSALALVILQMENDYLPAFSR
jgi:hypothetical protein